MFPFVLSTNGFYVPTYILINSAVFTLAVLWIFKRAQKLGYDLNKVLDLTFACMIASFIGARGFHVFYEQFDYYRDNPEAIFKFWQGGFVFFGGAISALIAGFLFCKYKKMNFLKHADLVAPVVAMGYGIGRLGCLAAGCCYGRPTTLPWGIIFPEGADAPAGIKLHPTQLYAFFWEVSVAFVLLWIEKQHSPKGFLGTIKKLFTRGKLVPGTIFGLWLTLHGVGRLMMEHFRDDFRGPQIFNLSVSTWVSMAALIGGLVLLLKRKR